MYCEKCGARIPDNGRFCGMCGAAANVPHPSSRVPESKIGGTGTAIVLKKREATVLIVVAAVLLIVLLIWLGTQGSSVNTKNGTEGLSYSYDNGAYRVTGYSGTSANVVIPDTYEGLPVTEVAFDTFYQNNTVKSVVLGKNIEWIGGYAFGKMEQLTSVAFTSSGVYLGSECFAGCENLKSVKFIGDASVSCLDYRVFYNCVSLKNFAPPEGLYQIDDEALAYCTKIKSFTIPSTVTDISSSAFRGWQPTQTIRITSCDPYLYGCEAVIKYVN